MSNSEIKLSANRALLFNIIPCIRFIYIEYISDDMLLLHIYADAPLKPDEEDLYSAVAGEISGDFTSTVRIDTSFNVDNRPYNPNNYNGILVYGRHENN